jgi:predicted nucleotidyltransferase
MNKIQLQAIAIMLFMMACNFRSNSNDSVYSRDSGEVNLVPLDTPEVLPDSLVPKEILESSIAPLVELGRETKTDENFNQYVLLKIKNVSKKTITNLMTVEGRFVSFDNNKFDEDKETVKNHRINLGEGKTMSLRIENSGESTFGWGLKLKK